ncbi:hypothetical protein GEI7407_1135 [Geitlerinema sp. PCC 7407]|nr:hypothetical protein GEI7407_1135 [Geitlerinema sp. PCC 7407]
MSKSLLATPGDRDINRFGQDFLALLNRALICCNCFI